MCRKTFLLSFLLLLSASPAFSATPGYNSDTGEIILPSEVYLYKNTPPSQNELAEIKAAEAQFNALQESAEETARIQLWENLDKEIKLRRYDKLVFEMRKNFNEAIAATNPFIGEHGYVIYPYGQVIPIITCRPMRMTDVALEPGEAIMGIHAGDTVRWMFAPSQSMKNSLAVSHIVVKPSQPGISTNLPVHTDKRTYNLAQFHCYWIFQYILEDAFSQQI